MSYILDTNVISELVAAQPDENVAHWIDSVDPERVFLSVITIGELKRGIEKLPDSRRKEQLERWLNEDLLVRFQDHLLAIDVDVMLAWGDLVARLEAVGKPMPAIDSLIAASAAQSDFTLVTRNVADFAHAGISVFNPWTFQG
ncbi:MAG TPA: type II toxin-antitoxin system VapC family toxin [Anaerolineales bacterium]|jgi:tRNA(fMet)-specific endonuclease VapC|nr:type II toxin-antitoxin system VapC family toxin [Anaerolineales bacterium]